MLSGAWDKSRYAMEARSSDRCSGSGYWSNAAKRYRAVSSETAIFIERHSCLIDCLHSQSKWNYLKPSGIEGSSASVFIRRIPHPFGQDGRNAG